MDANNSKSTPDKVTIRIATSKDVPLIKSLIREEAVTRGETEDSLPSIKKLLADGFESYPWFYYVLLAERAGAALGAAVFHRVFWTWSGRTLRLSMLYVRPRARRAGLGRRLFHELCHTDVSMTPSQMDVPSTATIHSSPQNEPSLTCVTDTSLQPQFNSEVTIPSSLTNELDKSADREILLVLQPKTELARLEGAQLDWEQPDGDQGAQAFFASFGGTPNDLSDGVYSMLMDDNIIDYVSKIDIQEPEVSNTNEAVIVRSARRDDLPEMNRMILELAEFEGENITPHLTEYELMKDAFGLSPWFFAVVAERGGQLVGLVIGNRIWRDRVRGLFAQTLYVSPHARRCGVAQKLMAQFCRMAADQGVAVVEFHVFRENVPSLVLYRQRLRAFDAPPLTAHAFRLTRKQIQQITL